MPKEMKKPGWRKLSAFVLIQALLTLLTIQKMADPDILDLPPNLMAMMKWNVLVLVVGNVGEHGIKMLKGVLGKVKITAAG